MSRRFTPGYQLNSISQLIKSQIANPNGNNDCKCLNFAEMNIFLDNGSNNPTQTRSQRLATLVSLPGLGGTTTFGVQSSRITMSGTREGQPGGMPKPFKNKF